MDNLNIRIEDRRFCKWTTKILTWHSRRLSLTLSNLTYSVLVDQRLCQAGRSVYPDNHRRQYPNYQDSGRPAQNFSATRNPVKWIYVYFLRLRCISLIKMFKDTHTLNENLDDRGLYYIRVLSINNSWTRD